MAVPSAFRKTEVVAVQHVMKEREKPLTGDGVEIRHLQQKIVIRGSPYREPLTAEINEVPHCNCIRIVQEWSTRAHGPTRTTRGCRTVPFAGSALRI
jgi:hypothetical protein